MNYLTTLIEIMSPEGMGVTYDHARSRLNITYRSAEGTAGHWVYECPLDLLLDRTRIDPETKRMLWPDLDVETASALHSCTGSDRDRTRSFGDLDQGRFRIPSGQGKSARRTVQRS
jgi:hypothetical protein